MLNEGLEVFGERWSDGREEFEGMVFAASGVEDVRVPSTVRVIGSRAFVWCSDLKRVEFSEGVESFGRDGDSSSGGCELFSNSGVEEVVFPGTLREVKGDVFKGCGSLRRVLVGRGCQVDVGRIVGKDVEVKYE